MCAFLKDEFEEDEKLFISFPIVCSFFFQCRTVDCLAKRKLGPHVIWHFNGQAEAFINVTAQPTSSCSSWLLLFSDGDFLLEITISSCLHCFKGHYSSPLSRLAERTKRSRFHQYRFPLFLLTSVLVSSSGTTITSYALLAVNIWESRDKTRTF